MDFRVIGIANVSKSWTAPQGLIEGRCASHAREEDLAILEHLYHRQGPLGSAGPAVYYSGLRHHRPCTESPYEPIQHDRVLHCLLGPDCAHPGPIVRIAIQSNGIGSTRQHSSGSSPSSGRRSGGHYSREKGNRGSLLLSFRISHEPDAREGVLLILAQKIHMKQWSASTNIETCTFISESDKVLHHSILTLIHRAMPVPKGATSVFTRECITAARTALKEHDACLALLQRFDATFLNMYIQW